MAEQWQPNRKQWLIIWAVVLLALAVWTNPGTLSPSAQRRGAVRTEGRRAVSILVIGALLVWQINPRRRADRLYPPVSLTDMTPAALVGSVVRKANQLVPPTWLIWLVVVVVTLVSVVVTNIPDGYPEVADVSGRMTPELLRAGTYDVPFSSLGRVRLTGGRYDKDREGFVALSETMAFGDLNGDGREDALLNLAVSGGGSGTFYYLVAILKEPGRAVQGPYFDLGDRVVVQELKILGGRVVVQMIDHGPADPLCCPTLSRTRQFILRSGQLVEMDVPRRPSAERPAQE